jgi:hypothetical protein
MVHLRLPFRLLLLLPVVVSLSTGMAAAGVIAVPPGNRSAEQPPISASSIIRTEETGGTFQRKYRQVYESLAGDRKLIGKIKRVAALYRIDPIHIVGAIVGEHTYNVDVLDSLQVYYVKALTYARLDVRFGYGREPLKKFLKRPEFARCAAEADDYDLWFCREEVWQSDFRGRDVDGVSYPDDRFERVFFQPFFAGQTFGLGQLSPLAALMVSDIVHAVSGLPRLDMNRAPKVYAAVMDPDTSLHYMAAIIRHDIDAYRAIAGFDVSGNPGITATLYNTGGSVARARRLAAENRVRRLVGIPFLLYPRENYYGWLINAHLDELRKLL